MSAIRFDLQGTLGSFQLAAKANIPVSGVTVVFGPSGCGKTTLLRCIAGLEQLEGEITIGEQVWQSPQSPFLPAHQRHIGMVFQEPRLFDHLTVKHNVLFGYRPSPSTRKSKLPQNYTTVMTLLGLAQLENRKPERLSGGEKQRVAIARALFCEPTLLLMDEPLAALDYQARDEILACLENLRLALSIPLIYVTHSHTEMAYLADRVLVMKAGQVVAQGHYMDMLINQQLPTQANQGVISVIESRFEGLDETGYMGLFSLMHQQLHVALTSEQAESFLAGDICRLHIAGRDVSVTQDYVANSSVLNQLYMRVQSILPSSHGCVDLALCYGDKDNPAQHSIVASITQKSLASLKLNKGDMVWAHIKGVSFVR
ncbi:MAG: molybdenum ABC transporter ATP-binding protein [Pontibacterium sp.]